MGKCAYQDFGAYLKGDKLPRSFEDFVGKILPKAKAKELLSYATFPLPTTSLIRNCLAKYNSIFLQVRTDDRIKLILPKLFEYYVYNNSDYLYVVEDNDKIDVTLITQSSIIKQTKDSVVYKSISGEVKLPKERVIPVSNLPYVSESTKRGLFTDVMGDLQWYLFYSLSKRYLDTYGAYPIYSGYESKCDYVNQKTGEYCRNGYMFTSEGLPCVTVDGERMQCPCCKEKKLIGAGSFVSVPIPTDGVPNLSDPVKMLSVDFNSLKYSVEEVDRLRDNIYFSITGDSTLLNKVAINNVQTDAILNKQKVLYESFKADTLELINNICTACNIEFTSYYPNEVISNISTQDLMNLIKEDLPTYQKSIVSDLLIREVCEEKGVDYREVEIINSLRPIQASNEEISKMWADGIITTEEYRKAALYDTKIAEFRNTGVEFTKENLEKWLKRR